MNDGTPDLLADFGLAGADRFDVLLVQHNVIRPGGQVEGALLCSGHAMEQSQKKPPSRSRQRRWLIGWGVLDEHGDIADTAAELFRKRVEHLRDHLDEMVALHFHSRLTAGAAPALHRVGRPRCLRRLLFGLQPEFKSVKKDAQTTRTIDLGLHDGLVPLLDFDETLEKLLPFAIELADHLLVEIAGLNLDL